MSTMAVDPEKARQMALTKTFQSKEQEAIQLEQNISDLQRQVKGGKLKTEKLHVIVQRYRDIDEEAREV